MSTGNDVYVDQSASELRLTVCEGALSLGQFNLLEEAHLAFPSGQIHAAIIGASHLLRFSFEDGSAHNEVFACVDVQTRGRRLASLWSGPWNELVLHFGRYRYSFTSRAWRASDQGLSLLAELGSKVKAASKNSGQLGLVHDFPRKEISVWVPQTLIWAQSDNRGAVIKTAHSYPEEDAVVITQSDLTLTEEGGFPR